MNAKSTSLLNLILIAFLLFNQEKIQAQPWMQNATDENGELNFFKIQANALEFFSHIASGKGNGYKPYKRWEEYWLNRVDLNGRFPEPDKSFKELEKYKQLHLNRNSSNQICPSTNWEPLGPYSSNGGYAGMGRINAIAFNPLNTNIIWVGSPGGGLWKSINNGDTWTSISDNFPVLGISSIAINPQNTDIMYVATGDGNAGNTLSVGVLKSTDGGLTWSTTGGNEFNQKLIRKIIIDPNNVNTLIAVTNYGIYATYDAAYSWSFKQYGNFYDLEANPNASSNILYACTENEIYNSFDIGNTWVLQETLPTSSSYSRTAIAVCPSSPSLVYALLWDNGSGDGEFGGLYKSSDNGNTYTIQSNSPCILDSTPDGSEDGVQGWYDLCLTVDPLDPSILYAGGVNTWKSMDGGNSWALNNFWYNLGNGTPTVHADKHAFEWQNNNTLWSGNDGGVYETSNGGAFWTDKSNGLVISQMYRVGVSQTDSKAITGLQDNGTKLKANNGTWSDQTGGDGMECYINPTNSNNLFSASQYGYLYRSTDGGGTWANISLNIPDNAQGNGSWITPHALNPLNSNIIYSAYRNVYKSVDQGNSWTTIGNSAAVGDFRKTLMTIAPSDPNVIYVGASSELFKTINGGSTWVNVNISSSWNITSLVFHPTNPDIIWITLQDYNISHPNRVYKSIDGGINWTDKTGTLPDIKYNCIINDKNIEGSLYIGTDLGIFYIDDSTLDWQLYFDGMPNVEVFDLEINYFESKIYAATYGRGLWRTDIIGACVPTLTCPPTVYIKCADDVPVADPEEITDEMDNCGIVSVDHSGDIITPGSCINRFTVLRTYTATNVCGISASCTQLIDVFDDISPDLEDLADSTINCTDAYPVNLPAVSDNCLDLVTLVDEFDEFVLDCPSNHLAVRTFTATDVCGNTSVTTQSILSLDTTGPEFVYVPEDMTVNCGEVYFVPEPIATDDCWVCVITYNVEVIPGDCAGTETIIRTYQASDGCDNYAYATQTITVIDSQAPWLSFGPDFQYGDTINLKCTQMFMSNIVNAQDNCDADVTITQVMNGVTYPTNCEDAGYLSIEQYTFTATDDCGNYSQFVIYIRRQDDEAPYFHQYPQDVIIACNGTVDMNAVGEWLNGHAGAIAEDLCSEFTWTNNLDINSLTCLGTTTLPVTFTVTDACGNSNSATANLTIVETPMGAMATVVGNITNHSTDASLKNVTVSLSGGINNSTITNASGDYSFDSAPLFDAYVVSPERNFDPLNGVTTYDAFLMRKHILGIQTLSTPYYLLAADVNRSGNITATDVLLTRKLILGIISDFPNNTSWRFVKSNYSFINPLNPFIEDIPEIGYIQNMVSNVNIDFKGIKVGDVNGSATSNLGETNEYRNAGTMTLTTTDIQVKKGEMISLPMKIDQSNVAGIQFTLNYDPAKLSFEGIQQGALEVDDSNYGVFEEKGAVTMSIDRRSVENDLAGKDLFSLMFKANNDLKISESLTLNSRITPAIVFLNNGEEMEISLAFENEGQIFQSEVFELYQNQPNPFKGTTSIGFNLPESSDIILKVFDESGRMLKMIEKSLGYGYHEIVLDSKELTGSGVYYYQLTTGKYSATKTMIILE